MARLKLQKQEPKESEIQSAVCEYLQLRRHFFWRNNTMGVQRTSLDGRMFWTNNKYSMKGIADIIVLTDGGYAVFIEVKRPSGRQSPEQKEFQRKCEEIGCEYYVIKSVDQLQEIGL